MHPTLAILLLISTVVIPATTGVWAIRKSKGY